MLQAIVVVRDTGLLLTLKLTSCYEWYLIVVKKNIYPDGPTLCKKALEIAEQLEINDFKASNGWLEKWKARHNIRKMVVSGEYGEVSGRTVDSWKERLPDILRGYEAQDILNIDETGCFWKALPTTGLAQKGKSCHGGKMSKVRVTVALLVNAAGEKEGKPIVIGKYENPRYFKGINKAQLPAQYFSQSKAWMSGNIMNSILQKLNRGLVAKKRHIILLMDNAGCHPQDLSGKYSNIKIAFFPPNTTSCLQPLDLGIIKNFKLYYRKLLLQHILAAYDIAKSVSILYAIRWIGQAWQMVKPLTIKNCFRKAAILNTDHEVVSHIGSASPDIDINELDISIEAIDDCTDDHDHDELELQSMMSQAQLGEDVCTAQEFITVDDRLPTCSDISYDDWEAKILF